MPRLRQWENDNFDERLKRFSECAHFQRIFSLAFYSRWNGYSESHRIEIRNIIRVSWTRRAHRITSIHDLWRMHISRDWNLNRFHVFPNVLRPTASQLIQFSSFGKRNSVGINLYISDPPNMPRSEFQQRKMGATWLRERIIFSYSKQYQFTSIRDCAPFHSFDSNLIFDEIENARHHYQLSGHYKRQLSIWLRLTQSNFVVWGWRVCDIWQCRQMICESACVSAPVTTCVFEECWSEKFVIWNSETAHADCRRNSTSLITKRNSEIISFVHSGARYRSRMEMHYNDRIINSKQVKNEQKFVYMKSKQIEALSTVHVRMFDWIPELMHAVRKVFEMVRCVGNSIVRVTINWM